MYFPFFELKKWGKKAAEARRAQLCGVALDTMRWLGHLPAHSCGFHFSTFRQNKPFRGIITILPHIL